MEKIHGQEIGQSGAKKAFFVVVVETVACSLAPTPQRWIHLIQTDPNQMEGDTPPRAHQEIKEDSLKRSFSAMKKLLPGLA